VGSSKKSVFKDFYPPETVATTSTATDSKFGLFDDDVLVHLNPCYIGTTPEMSSSRPFDEETGLIKSKTVEKQLFLDHTVIEAAVSRNTGGSLGHFGSAMATPDVINASNAHGYRLSSNQNRSGIECGRCATENTPSAHDVVHSGENIGISKVDFSHYGMDTSKTAQPGVSGCVGDCGISDLLLAYCAGMMATAMVIKVFLRIHFLKNGLKVDQNFKQVQQSLIISSRYVTSLLI
jgi:hypothetical protein